MWTIKQGLQYEDPASYFNHLWMQTEGRQRSGSYVRAQEIAN